MRTPSPFVPTTTTTTTADGSPQEQKAQPLQNVNRTMDEMKLKDVTSPEIIVEEDGRAQSREEEGGVGDSFGKAESSLSSVSVLCSPCLSVSHHQVRFSSPRLRMTV